MEKDIHDRLDRARAIARENLGKAADGLKSGAEKIGGHAKSASETASKRLDGARLEAGKGIDKANRLITEHPVASVAIAIAVGGLAAYFFPKTARAVRKAAPRIANAAASAGREAKVFAKSNLPIEEAEKALDQLTDAARKANAATAEMAKAGLNNARAIAIEAARRAEIDAQANRVLSAATDAASKLLSKSRKADTADSGEESGEAPPPAQ